MTKRKNTKSFEKLAKKRKRLKNFSNNPTYTCFIYSKQLDILPIPILKFLHFKFNLILSTVNKELELTLQKISAS